MKCHLVSLFVDMPVCCTRAEPWLESLVPCLINSVCGVPDILFTRQLCIPRMQRHTIYSLHKTIMYYKNVKTPTLEYGRRAPPHHCCDKDGGGKRKMSRGRQKRESSILSSSTHPSPSQMGPAEKLGWLGALTRNQSEKYSEKYTAKS